MTEHVNNRSDTPDTLDHPETSDITDVATQPQPAGSRRGSLRRIMLAVGLVATLALPWFVYPPVAMDIAAWALFAISVDLLLGYTGLLSFGHAAFWGSSSYVTGLIAIS